MKQNDMNQYVKEWFEKNEERVYQLMREMWEHPELSLQEYHACEIMEQFAREEGFTEIQTHAAQDWDNPEARPNTLIASWGSGHPVISIVGELDALPELGQKDVQR